MGLKISRYGLWRDNPIPTWFQAPHTHRLFKYSSTGFDPSILHDCGIEGHHDEAVLNKMLLDICNKILLLCVCQPCVPIISHRRSVASVGELGENLLVVWKPDSSMIAVATTGGHVIFYNIVVYTEVRHVRFVPDPGVPDPGDVLPQADPESHLFE